MTTLKYENLITGANLCGTHRNRIPNEQGRANLPTSQSDCSEAILSLLALRRSFYQSEYLIYLPNKLQYG